MQNTECADFNWEKCTLHVQPKAWRKFRLKGKSKKKSAKDRFIPVPAKLVWKIKERMRQRNAQPHDLVFPNGEGKPDGHFLRKLKAIAKKAGVEDAELHRFRKTYADTLHEEGVKARARKRCERVLWFGLSRGDTESDSTTSVSKVSSRLGNSLRNKSGTSVIAIYQELLVFTACS
jgi:integrase